MGIFDKFLGEEKLLEKGKEALEKKEYKKAIDYFDMVLDKNSDNFYAKYYSGKVYLERKNSSEAIRIFLHLQKSDPEDKRVLESLADAYFLGDASKEAVECYDKLLQKKDNIYIAEKKKICLIRLITKMKRLRASPDKVRARQTQLNNCLNYIINKNFPYANNEEKKKIEEIKRRSKVMLKPRRKY